MVGAACPAYSLGRDADIKLVAAHHRDPCRCCDGDCFWSHRPPFASTGGRCALHLVSADLPMDRPRGSAGSPARWRPRAILVVRWLGSPPEPVAQTDIRCCPPAYARSKEPFQRSDPRAYSRRRRKKRISAQPFCQHMRPTMRRGSLVTDRTKSRRSLGPARAATEMILHDDLVVLDNWPSARRGKPLPSDPACPRR